MTLMVEPQLILGLFIFLDACHPQNAVQMLQKKGCHFLTGHHLHLNFISNEGTAISPGEAISLSKDSITSKAIVRKETTFLDEEKMLVNYTAAFLTQKNVSSLDAWIKDIVEDTILSVMFLTRNSTNELLLCMILRNFYRIMSSSSLCWRDGVKKCDHGKTWEYCMLTVIGCMGTRTRMSY